MSMEKQNRTASSNGNSNQNSSDTGSNSDFQDMGIKAQQKTGELIDQAQEKVGEVKDKVKQQATSQVSSQKDRAAEGLGNVAEAIRQTGEQLRQNEKVAPVAQYTDQLAQGVEMASNYLRDHNLSDIFGELERFARREPALFLGGALTLGLLGGRFLRSSGGQNSQFQSNGNGFTGSSEGTGNRTYGSRSTGYSTSLSSDPVAGYSAYDLGTTDGAARGMNQSASGRLYNDDSGLDDGGAVSDSGSTGTSGYNSGYPVDILESEISHGYGSQTNNTGRESGGSTGGA